MLRCAACAMQRAINRKAMVSQCSRCCRTRAIVSLRHEKICLLFLSTDVPATRVRSSFQADLHPYTTIRHARGSNAEEAHSVRWSGGGFRLNVAQTSRIVKGSGAKFVSCPVLWLLTIDAASSDSWPRGQASRGSAGLRQNYTSALSSSCGLVWGDVIAWNECQKSV